jgi:hypothetical protein
MTVLIRMRVLTRCVGIWGRRLGGEIGGGEIFWAFGLGLGSCLGRMGLRIIGGVEEWLLKSRQWEGARVEVCVHSYRVLEHV